MGEKHVANAVSEFRAVNVSPDFCIVDGKPCPFEIFRDLTPERLHYTKKTQAWGVPILTVDSVVSGVVGNMGKGVLSGVSQGGGDVLMIIGSDTVIVEGRPVCRDQDLCLMNVKS